MNGVNELTNEITGAAIEVHRTLGPGLLESTYEGCLLASGASSMSWSYYRKLWIGGMRKATYPFV